MSNLLERSSLVLTPTAYNNGEALCIKPDDASGDFQFSRNSAATRVNAQGLVENVQILSSNLVQNGDFSEEGVQEVSNGSFSQEGVQLVTNGDFSNGSANWNLGASWSIVNEKAVNNGASNSFLTQNSIVQNGKSYLVSFDIADMTQGSLQLRFGSGAIVTESFTSNGTKTSYYVSSGDAINFYSVSGFDGSIDNCSVREVGQDWVLNGWEISENKATCDASGGTALTIQQQNILTSGKTYKITYTILDYVQGNLRFRSNPVSSGYTSGNGEHTVYIVAQNATFGLQGLNGFIGSVTNISVKEVLQDWSVKDYGAVSPSAVITPNTEGVKLEKTVSADWRSSFLVQPISYTNGSQYKVTFKLKNGNLPSGGSVFVRRAYDSSSQSIVNNLTLTNDWVEYTYYFVADSNSEDISFGEVNWQNAGVGQYFYIDDVTLIEITDDTNLPRINYEGFSYQDALGSELVTNGDFATDSNWSKTNAVIENGKATLNTVNSAMSSILQSSVMEQNKTYKITFDAILLSGVGGLTLARGGNNNVTNSLSISQSGTFSQVLKWVSTDTTIGIKRSGGGDFSWSIDNVSVKEYLGQEVVPDSGCGSWLWEPQSTNLITQSEALSTMQNQSTVTDNVLKSPTGNVNASLVVENTATNSHGITKSNIIPTNPSATSYTVSIFAKKKERQYIQFWLYADSTSFTSSGFDLENGTTSGDANTHKIKDFGNGWYRCSFTANVTQSTGGFNFARVSMGTSPTSFYYTGDGASGLYMFGYQLEQQSYATSYIPTSGSSVTRNQDVCTNGGSLATINSTEGTLYVEGSFSQNGRIALMNTSTSDQVVIGFSTSIFYRIKENNVNVITNFFSSANELNRVYKIAVKYQSGNCSIFVDGVKEIDTNTFSLSNLSEIKFVSEGQYLFGKTKAVAVWKEALSDQELLELTTI